MVADLSKVWIEADLTEALLSRVRVGADDDGDDRRLSGRALQRPRHLRGVDARQGEAHDPRAHRSREQGRPAEARDVRHGYHHLQRCCRQTGGRRADRARRGDRADAGVPSVFVFENGGYEQRAIEPGDKLGGRTVVKSGLKAGEQVVGAGTYALKARVPLKSQIGDEH